MKRLLYLFISLCMIFSLVSCSGENTLVDNVSYQASWTGLETVISSSDILVYTETVDTKSKELANQAVQYAIEDLSEFFGYETIQKVENYEIIICSSLNLNCSGYTDTEKKIVYVNECPIDLLGESTALVYYTATITHELMHACSYVNSENVGFAKYTYYEGKDTYDVANAALNEAFTQYFTVELMRLTCNVELANTELDTYTDFRPLVNALVERDGIEKWKNLYLTSDISKLEEIQDFSNISKALDTMLADGNQAAYEWAVRQLTAQKLWKK